MRFDSSLRSDAVVRRSSRLIPTFINMESVVFNGQHFCLWRRRFGFESRQTPMTYECSLTVKIGGSNPSDGGSIPSTRAIIGCVKLVSLMMLVLNHDIADE